MTCVIDVFYYLGREVDLNTGEFDIKICFVIVSDANILPPGRNSVVVWLSHPQECIPLTKSLCYF